MKLRTLQIQYCKTYSNAQELLNPYLNLRNEYAVTHRLDDSNLTIKYLKIQKSLHIYSYRKVQSKIPVNLS